jgi:DNA-binding CsgD family transcriptional regulator
MISAPRQSLLSTEISAMRARSQCLTVIRSITRAFGMSHGSIMAAPSAADVHVAPLLLETTLPSDFIHEFDRHQFVRQCPLLKRYAQSIVPHTWDLMNPSSQEDEELWPETMRDLMLRYGLVVGFVCIFNLPDSRRYIVRFEGDRPSILLNELNELTMITMELFDQYNSLLRAEMSSIDVLSVRELEVVRWTAQGKTSIEIGQILALSDHTINAYMMTAMKKLDCVNRTQLVAKAIRLKLIQ